MLAVKGLNLATCSSTPSLAGGGCRAASRILTQLAGLLHGCETGTLRLGMLRRHLGQLRAVQTSTTAALTALSGLIRTSVTGTPELMAVFFGICFVFLCFRRVSTVLTWVLCKQQR